MLQAAELTIASELTESSDKRLSMLQLLSRAVIQSFCPLLRSEILLGGVDTNPQKEVFGYWVEQEIHGQPALKVGIGCDKVTLRNIALHLGTQQSNGLLDLANALNALQKVFSSELEKLYKEEDLNSESHLEGQVRLNFEFTPVPNISLICPIETKFGIIKICFDVLPEAGEVTEGLTFSPPTEPRKIRVHASQLDTLFFGIRRIESLERKLLSGPHIRSQMRSEIKRLKRLVHHLKSEPLENLFAPARRLAVDIAKQEGKQILFTTAGTWLSLDKALLNMLYEPILHLVRNAVDHGIEVPSERERLGKPAIGKIKCLATFSEKGLRLILSDDGKGLDFPRIRSRAVAKGLLSSDEANQKLSSDLCAMIFEPGFSTRDRADSISGRGLGLDIVKKGIENAGGTIRILSTSNHGTSFEVLIPLNEHLSLTTRPLTEVSKIKEEEEKAILLDELARYFENLTLSLGALHNESSIKAAYEAYRQAHSIKATAGFLGWNRVVGFCHHFEDLLKLVAEQRLPLDESLLHLVSEAAHKLYAFCEASRQGIGFPLFGVRRIEARILQMMWAATHSDDRTHLFFGKYQLQSVQKILHSSMGSNTGALVTRPEADIHQAMKQPFGALVQFNGDRRGYAGILMPEKTFYRVIQPLVSGRTETVEVKGQIWALNEFANLMGMELSQAASRAGIELQSSAPLIYYGWGQPLSILGTPTYCYACSVAGEPFYLAGDFRSPQDIPGELEPWDEINCHPDQLAEEARTQCRNHFAQWNLPITFSEVPSQSDLIGFDGGITVIISCIGKSQRSPKSVLFLSYEPTLANYIQSAFVGQTKDPLPANHSFELPIDLYDCLCETSNIMGGSLVSELEKKKILLQLSLPTVFAGKAYVANFNRLFVTNKWVGTTAWGKLELQVMVMNSPS